MDKETRKQRTIRGIITGLTASLIIIVAAGWKCIKRWLQAILGVIGIGTVTIISMSTIDKMNDSIVSLQDSIDSMQCNPIVQIDTVIVRDTIIEEKKIYVDRSTFKGCIRNITINGNKFKVLNMIEWDKKVRENDLLFDVRGKIYSNIDVIPKTLVVN